MEKINFWLYKFLTLFIFVSLGIAEEATILTTKVGDYVILDCEIDFPQNIIIPHVLQWEKDAEIIFSWSNGKGNFNDKFLNRISLLADNDAWQRGRGSINLTNIRETDNGWYQCKVIFTNQTPSMKNNGTWFHLLVEGGNLIAVPPVNETTSEGNSVNLKCVSKIFPSEVVWYKNNVPILNLEDIRERIQILREGSLHIIRTGMNDSGYYSCEITNEEGEKQAAGAYLNVEFKARVLYAPRRIYLPYGKPADLNCYYKANPDINKIRWEKDGFLFDAYNVPGVFARRNGSLFYSKVDESHAGDYTCTPYNNHGTNGPSPRMQVIVQTAPVFTVTPHILYLRRVGEKVVMHCDAVDGQGGPHQPAISWSKKNGQVPENRSTTDGGNLTIVNIQLDDRGSYECTAKNEAATIFSQAELLVQEIVKSHIPYNVSTVVTKDSVTVKWIAKYGKPSLKFSVWYRNDSSQDWRMIPHNNNMYEVKIADSVPNKTYDVMVLSHDDSDDVMFSKTDPVTTKNDELRIEDDVEQGEVDRKFRSPIGLYQQIGPPTDLYIQVVEEGYKLIWKPPRRGQEMFRYFTVLWYKDPSDERIGAIETKLNYAIIRNLEEQKTYRFQVLAMSTNDYEAPSQKYIYHVPTFPIKKSLISGAVAGAVLVIIIVSLLWYLRKPHRKRI